MTLERITAVPTLPKRPRDSHKGLFGSILVVAGGRGMAGAAALAGASALRSGAGLVRIACPGEVQATVATFEPSYMTYPLATDADGLLAFPACRTALGRLLEHADVLAVGPGLGQSGGLSAFVRWVIEEVELPTVVDADGLNGLVGQTDILHKLRRPLVITPHPGEFARLVGSTAAVVQADREHLAVEFAQTEHLIVVLKGANTLVTDGRRVYVNTTGNPGMATGGAGDVLTGVLAAMLGQKLPPFEAAQLAVYAHGLAGDIARDQNGEIGLIAGDIVDSLADAFYHLSSPSDET
jgi:NAD(P)H-hydrate epimerase